MPMRKNIKISAAKRGHHERHKKNFGKSKKTIEKESALNKAKRENIFGKKQNVSKAQRNETKRRKGKKNDPAPEVTNKTDLKDRMNMIRDSSDEDYYSEEELPKGVDATEDMELRHLRDVEFEEETEMRELLPIKTKDGLIPRSTVVVRKQPVKEETEEEEEEPEIETVEDDENADSDQDIMESLVKDIKAGVKTKVSTAELLAERQHLVESLTYKIGVLCSGILEKPEEKIRNLTTLLYLIDETNKEGRINLPSVRKLAILSLVEIFKDIVPEYRVGIVDLEAQQVRKQTLQRVSYENNLLTYYRKFLTRCEHMAAKVKLNSNKYSNERATPQEIAFAEVAIQAMCDLLVEHPYFNYGQNIAQFLVAFMDNNNENIRKMLHKSFTTIFKIDKRMDLTQHIVRHINEQIKKKENVNFVELVSCLLSLQIKDINLDAEKQNEIKQKKLEQKKSRVINLSKKERKRKKKLAELEKELLETKAEENKQSKNEKLVTIMKYTFTVYFRVLKKSPNSKLLSVTLEGLAKFAHMINIEFFHDLIEVLHKLLQEADLGYREQLHCVQTVFTILSGQGEVLNIDPARFYSHLYKNLLSVHAGQNHTDVESILITVENVLIKRRKHMTQQRSLAFLKRLMILSMQLLHNGALGCLALIKTSLQLNNQLDILLDIDAQVGSGKYDPNIEEPEYSNANCTNLWEVELLHRHYHPTVRKYVNYIASGVPTTGNGVLPAELGKLTAHDLYHQFDSSDVSFNPAIPVPNRKQAPAKRTARHEMVDSTLRTYCKRKLKETSSELTKNKDEFNFYLHLPSSTVSPLNPTKKRKISTKNK